MFTTAKEFAIAFQSVEKPDKPVEPYALVDINDFESDADYFSVLCLEVAKYDAAMLDYVMAKRKVYEKEAQILREFKTFCFKSTGLDYLSEDTQDHLYTTAWKLKSHTDGMVGVYDMIKTFPVQQLTNVFSN